MKLNRRNFMIKFFLALLGLFFFDILWFEKYIIQCTKLNDIKMYVSKGIGTKYIPIRMGCRAEASIFYI